MLALPGAEGIAGPVAVCAEGPSKAEPRPSFGFRACDPSLVASHDASLVRLLAVVDVDVLGVDHVAGLLAAWRAAALRTRRSARRAGLRAASRRLLVEFLGHFLQGLLDVFGRGAKSRDAAFVHGFLGVIDGLLGGLDVGVDELVAVLADRFLGLVDDAVEAVARFDLFHTPAIVLGMRFGLGAHFFRFFL